MDTTIRNYTYNEIMSQPEVWKTNIEALHNKTDEITSWLNAPRENVFFIGCGSTHYLSLHSAAVWQALTGEIARGIPASELFLFPDMYLSEAPSLLIAVSRSAETTETLWALETFKKRVGENNLCITCYPEHELSAAANHVLGVVNGAEHSVVQTRSFTSMTIMADFLAGIAARRKDFLKKITSLPENSEVLINNYGDLFKNIGYNLNIERFIFLGSGSNYGIACEAMIKMKEMTLTNSEAFHILEFRHGPKAIVDNNTAIIGLLSDAGRDEEAAVLSEVRDLGAYVITIDESGNGLPSDVVVSINSEFGDLLRGILALPLMQLMAYHRALAKNLDPDHPRNLESAVCIGKNK